MKEIGPLMFLSFQLVKCSAAVGLQNKTMLLSAKRNRYLILYNTVSSVHMDQNEHVVKIAVLQGVPFEIDISAKMGYQSLSKMTTINYSHLSESQMVPP